MFPTESWFESHKRTIELLTHLSYLDSLGLNLMRLAEKIKAAVLVEKEEGLKLQEALVKLEEALKKAQERITEVEKIAETVPGLEAEVQGLKAELVEAELAVAEIAEINPTPVSDVVDETEDEELVTE